MNAQRTAPAVALMHRLPGALGAGGHRATLQFELDGQPCTALQGDTVLTAILTQANALRASDASGQPRAGFCLMGACQDCWVQAADGLRLRACSTLVAQGMRLVTGLGTNLANDQGTVQGNGQGDALGHDTTQGPGA